MAKPNRLSRDEFKSLIVSTAQEIEKQTRFPWQLIAAQACLETGYGQSVPVDMTTGKYSFNIFGIKGTGPAGSVLCRTSEYFPEAQAKKLVAAGNATPTSVRKNGKAKVYVKDRFKAFHSFKESLEGYMQLMKKPRYAAVWDNADDPVAAAETVQLCGYATDVSYAEKLISIMEREGWV